MKYYLDHANELTALQKNYKNIQELDRRVVKEGSFGRDWTHLVTFDANLTTFSRVMRAVEAILLTILTLGLIVICSDNWHEKWKIIRKGKEQCIVYLDTIQYRQIQQRLTHNPNIHA